MITLVNREIRVALTRRECGQWITEITIEMHLVLLALMGMVMFKTMILTVQDA